MLELNKYFFWQLINFLLLLAALNYILFKPLLALLKKRDDDIKGSLNSARAMEKEREDHLNALQAKLIDARGRAKTVFEELSKQGGAAQKESVDRAQKEAVEINRKSKESLEAEVKRTKESLRGQVEAFSKLIIEKMVGA
ncbi:MAG: hypothetical protein HY758_03980 [Nitrospirae bacterium]|nr:hypothetical protein [Nitrospirota bacterium]